MTYKITLTTYHPNMSAKTVISRALGFEQELSHATVIGIFSETSLDGVFTNKSHALNTARKINDRGAFGGYGTYQVIATVEEG